MSGGDQGDMNSLHIQTQALDNYTRVNMSVCIIKLFIFKLHSGHMGEKQPDHIDQTMPSSL